jgi:hypothetical protein
MGLEPGELLAWAADTDWAEALHRAWRDALFAAPEPAWSAAFLRHWPRGAGPDGRASVLALLPLAEREAHWLRLLEGDGELPDTLLAQLGPGCRPPQHLSLPLAQRLADRVVQDHGVRVADLAYPVELAEKLRSTMDYHNFVLTKYLGVDGVDYQQTLDEALAFGRRVMAHIRDIADETSAALGAEIVQPPGHAWRDEIEQRNAYFQGDPGDWYLVLDADERVSGALPSNVPSTTLDGPGAYRATLNATPRLIQQRGTLRYQYTHWTVYCDDVLLAPVQRCVAMPTKLCATLVGSSIIKPATHLLLKSLLLLATQKSISISIDSVGLEFLHRSPCWKLGPASAA